MFLYERVTQSRFIDIMGLGDDKYHSFDYQGLVELYTILEQNAEELGEPLELCPVSIRTQYVQYDSFFSLLDDLNILASDYIDETDIDQDIKYDAESNEEILSLIAEQGILHDYGGWFIFEQN